MIWSFILWIHRVGSEIANDTLKRKDPDGTRRWSRTSLTMASAWFLCCLTYAYDVYKEGFRLDAFTIMVGVALGSKWIDAKSKKIEQG